MWFDWFEIGQINQYSSLFLLIQFLFAALKIFVSCFFRHVDFFFLFFNVKTFEEKEHFSTYALNSKTGATHWKHEPGDYEATKHSREVLLRLKMSLINMQIFSPKSIIFGHWSVCTGIICIGLCSSRHQQERPKSIVFGRWSVCTSIICNGLRSSRHHKRKTPPKRCAPHQITTWHNLRHGLLTQDYLARIFTSVFVKPKYKSILSISITLFISWWRGDWMPQRRNNW